MIDWHLLQAIGGWRTGERDKSMSDMLTAIRLAAPSAITRPFIDQRDSAINILRVLRKERSHREIDRAMDRLINGLLGGTRGTRPFAHTRPSLTLAPREREIIELLGRKLSNKEIGRTLNISDSTVK